jgi:putative Holliday junction resolvase
MLTSPTILALDVGGQRIGVARANTIARIASPLVTLINDDSIFDEITALIKAEDVGVLVIGLPRGLDGQETAQTQVIRDFVAELKTKTDLPVYFQDEALTSQKAEDELESRGKPFSKGDIDALAATFILDDFLQDNAGVLA